MGNRNSDNPFRRAYRDDKPLFQIMQESSGQQVTPEAREQRQLADIGRSRKTLQTLENQLKSAADAESSLTSELDHTRDQIMTLEKQLKTLKAQARDQERALKRAQMARENEERMLSSHQERLSRMEQEQRSQQPGRQDDHPVFARHRDNQIVPQARAVPLEEDFQPPEWCYQKLEQHKGIPKSFAEQQLEDFRMYWLSTGEARKAWGYQFIKHVEYAWRRNSRGENRTERSQPTTDELTDRSWADKYGFDLD